ncbi:MAG TPA: carboxypeptidase-like regulatory domain-containing protein, partial [Polyangiaceae bacterium]|nr:carboxypeptidase-like regulatory domain-containing protein [Polyangiaceae bacterium]
MSYRARVVPWASALLVIGVAAAALGACSAGTSPPGKADGNSVGNSGGGGNGGSGKGGSSETGGTTVVVTGGSAGTIGVAGTSGTAGGCGTVICNPEGGDYCGQIGDNCGGSLDCGVCENAGWMCEEHVCVGGADCVPNDTCTVGGTTFCGEIGDGCGHGHDCGACPQGQECRGRVCVTPGCVPLTCAMGAYTFCGDIGDGCGGTLHCNECPAGYTCGGGMLEGVCGATDCPTKVSCDNAQGMQQYCGTIGSGCGGILECPATCENGMTCGMETPNVCPGTGGPTCTRLQCQVTNCPTGGQAATVLTGVVRDPAGTNPIYNAVVYVPNDALPLPDVPSGATCDRCGAGNVNVVTSTLTDTTGAFRLTGVPSGANIPLVIQVGKWRRVVTIANVPSCTATALPADQTRLPRNRMEGSIPKIAAVTGGSDALECLLRRIGIDESEFGIDGSAARVHLYAGGNPTKNDSLGTSQLANGTVFPGAYTTLYSSVPKMLGYDITVLSCEGSQLEDEKAPYYANM